MYSPALSLPRSVPSAVVALLLSVGVAFAQNPTGTIEGLVTDRTGGIIPDARVTGTQIETGLVREVTAGPDGLFRLLVLPIGTYRIVVEADGFSRFVREDVPVSVGQILRIDARLDVSGLTDAVEVIGGAPLVETSSNALGRVVTGRELVDLPLNGRNFTELGLLQTGASPLTAGVRTAGGSLRAGHAYAVNGMRPEQNAYLVDGAANMNRMDGGYALRLPVDAIAEFRILTQSAPPEYGGTGGATTSVVMRSGSNLFSGSVYEFVRNDAFDARNFFSEKVEPLEQHQFGGTIGGPIQRERAFFFGYYEGFRNRQGITTSATVPTAAERAGDFSAMGTPLINFAAGGIPFPGNRIPEAAIHPVAGNVVQMYPLGNVSPSIYRETVVARNNFNSLGGRLDHHLSPSTQLFARHAYSGGHNVNPVSVRGTDVPGFPTRDDVATHSSVVALTQILSPSVTHTIRAGYLRHRFFFDQRLNRTPPRDLGFGFDPVSEVGQGPPFFNVAGYTPIGGAITGPRNSTQQTFEVRDGLTWARGAHLVKAGGEVQHTAIDMFQAIAPNAFFVFASTFPTNNAVANLLLGAPVIFYQGWGDFDRDLRVWNAGAYLQNEWRAHRNVTLNVGLRYERINPSTESEDRMNGFIPGVQSTVRPNAPAGLVFPGDPGIGRGIAEGANAFMPRAGIAWDPDGRGIWAVRASYGLFYEPFQNGSGAASQVPISSTPWAQFVQFSGAGLDFQNPYAGRPLPGPDTWVRPTTLFVMDPEAKPPYTQQWNVGIQRSLLDRYLVEVRYVGAEGRRLPRNVEANPAVFGPGATAQNADRRRIYANCPDAVNPCELSTVAMLRNITRSSYHAAQASVSRRYAAGVGLNVSYWLSRSMDHLSSLNLSGAAARPLAGANDLAQNPFDLEAEWGPSLFDARHRIVASATWAPRVGIDAPATIRAVFRGWQVNGIATYNAGTPFTVADSANVSLQANSPPISGFPASRPDVVGDPNAGPRTVNEWMSRSAFQRLDPITQAGQFGNAGRNIVRGPSYRNLDVSLVRDFAFDGGSRLQFRAEAFNVLNTVNLGLPVADLNSPNFGRILSAGPPRLMQFAVKYAF